MNSLHRSRWAGMFICKVIRVKGIVVEPRLAAGPPVRRWLEHSSEIKVDQQEKAQTHQLRATVVAALIGAIATIAGSLIGVSFGRDQATDQRTAKIAELQKIVDEQAAQIEQLRKDRAHVKVALPRPSPPRENVGSLSVPVRVKPDGVQGSGWWIGDEPPKAFDGNLRTYWGIDDSRARGAWVEFLLREPKTLDSLRLYTPPDSSGFHIREMTLVGDNGVRRKIGFRGLNGWEEVSFEPLQVTLYGWRLMSYGVELPAF